MNQLERHLMQLMLRTSMVVNYGFNSVDSQLVFTNHQHRLVPVEKEK